MTKDELKVGYGVVLRDGTKGIVVPYDNDLIGICFFGHTWMPITDLTDNLTCYGGWEEFDVVKVYGLATSCADAMDESFESRRELLWERNDKPIADTAEDILMYGMEILSED